MTEALVQFIGTDGKIRLSLPLFEKEVGNSEFSINDGHGRLINLKHLDPDLSLILTGKNGVRIGNEYKIKPGETKKFLLTEFSLRIAHDPILSFSLK